MYLNEISSKFVPYSSSVIIASLMTVTCIMIIFSDTLTLCEKRLNVFNQSVNIVTGQNLIEYKTI